MRSCAGARRPDFDVPLRDAEGHHRMVRGRATARRVFCRELLFCANLARVPRGIVRKITVDVLIIAD